MIALRIPAAVLLLCGAAARAQQPERITFPEAVQRALARNASVRIAVQEIARAHGIMREVRSAAIPTLFANGVYTRLDADGTTGVTVVDPATGATSTGTRTVQPRDSWAANLQLAVPLIAPQRWVQWEHASEQVDVARLSAEDVRRQTAIVTARVYVSVLAQHRLVDANQRAADNAREHNEDAKARLSAGPGHRLAGAAGAHAAALRRRVPLRRAGAAARRARPGARGARRGAAPGALGSALGLRVDAARRCVAAAGARGEPPGRRGAGDHHAGL